VLSSGGDVEQIFHSEFSERTVPKQIVVFELRKPERISIAAESAHDKTFRSTTRVSLKDSRLFVRQPVAVECLRAVPALPDRARST